MCYNPRVRKPVPLARDNYMSEPAPLNVCESRTYTQKPLAVSLSLSTVLFHVHTGEPVPPSPTLTHYRSLSTSFSHSLAFVHSQSLLLTFVRILRPPWHSRKGQSKC